MKIVGPLVCIVLAAGCGKSKCEKYAEMEVRCGGYPASEAEMTSKLAEGFCEHADEVGKEFGEYADCAAKFLGKSGADCGGYKACHDAVAAKHGK